MQRIYLTILLPLLLLCSQIALGQSTVISGKITDADSKEPLVGAVVMVKSTVIGTTTNTEGQFSLKLNKVPATLVISMLGYAPQEVEANGSAEIAVALTTQAIMGKEVVVSASRVSEDVLTSPVTVEKMDIRALQTTAAPSYFDALASQKGVDVIASSMVIKSVNARGFNAPFNPRFVVRVDGMDTQSPGFNMPLSNILGVSDLDLDNTEFIPGTASALYGPSAFNGILNVTSRDPFMYQGLGLQVKSGIMSSSADASNPFYDLSFRYAKAFNNRFAFKLNASYLRATDWYADDRTDINRSNGTLNGRNNPAQDMVNAYGDETAVLEPISKASVSRTGYMEKDLVDYSKTQNLKLDGWLHYKITPNLEASYMFKYATATGIIQGGNRFWLDGINFMQHRVEVKGSNFYVRAYTTMQDLGNSYDTRALANGLNATTKADTTWRREYGEAFGGKVVGISKEDHLAARAYADRNRLLPGTDAFNQAKNRLTSTLATQGGAKMYEKPTLSAIEGQWDLTNTVKFMEVLVGGNYRRFASESNGYLYDDVAKPNDNVFKQAAYYEYGAFVQASKKLLNDKLRLTGALRWDKSEFFDGLATPRLSAVYTLGENHHFRASYQTGFKSPIMQEQFINLDLGGGTYVIGGINGLIQGNPAQTNAYTIASVTAFGNGFGASMQATGGDFAKSYADNAGKLQKANLGFVKPERVQSVELGYKTLINNKLYVDVNYYYSQYTDFIGFGVVMNVPTPVSDPNAGLDILTGKGKVYVTYTNASNEVYAQGFSGNVNYAFEKGYTLGANFTWTKLYKRDANDPIVPAFNTPEYKTNITFGNRNVFKNIGFNVTWRWQDAFLYEFPFAGGVSSTIPSFSTLDAQVSYRLMKNTSIKVAGANILNQRYVQGLGTPSIGAMYFVSLTFDPTIR